MVSSKHEGGELTFERCHVREGKSIRIDIVFVDQNGQKRTLRNVRIDSDEKKRRKPVKLQEEAVYKLEHEVEKKVAAVLKDEISRYKKFGRQHERQVRSQHERAAPLRAILGVRLLLPLLAACRLVAYRPILVTRYG